MEHKVLIILYNINNRTLLLKDKKAYIVTSSGGVYSEGELKPYDFATNYVSFFLNLLGIEVVNVFRVEGQAIVGPENALVNAIENIVINDPL
ncbi:NAD(P)H-dependent oxidoreductase [Chryseobacterium lathyri]|uniref:NAD(P)H-dependent oxidoreductase n=1 Tax=Chryseobacterium lathyri TaxID=395933 RepID=UPI002780C3D2|nr:NAD(P)H-dependent oxidoreductase [Chryseobacterium lathyri]MDQ0064243.1 FMN-dependent NADH-azoreductase [Chryseobacterium lathyri]